MVAATVLDSCGDISRSPVTTVGLDVLEIAVAELGSMLLSLTATVGETVDAIACDGEICTSIDP